MGCFDLNDEWHECDECDLSEECIESDDFDDEDLMPWEYVTGEDEEV